MGSAGQIAWDICLFFPPGDAWENEDLHSAARQLYERIGFATRKRRMAIGLHAVLPEAGSLEQNEC